GAIRGLAASLRRRYSRSRKHVEPWPISIAREDLRATVALYYYAKYGLDMRSALEVKGPYDLAPLDVRYRNAIGVLFRQPPREAQSYFKRHRKFVEQAASVKTSRRVEFLTQSAEEPIPLEVGSIDTAVITWALCSIPNPSRALGEVRRVLKPDGALI